MKLTRCLVVSFSIVVLAIVVQVLLELALRQEFKVHKVGVVVISGTSTGIGRDAALALAQIGHVVFCGVRKEADVLSLTEEAKKTAN